MSESTASLSRKIGSATDLQSVVRTMKAVAASSLGQYENAVRSTDDYFRTVQLALTACLRPGHTGAQAAAPAVTPERGVIAAVVFGSDQGLVGQFNDVLMEFVQQTLGTLGAEARIWAVGERIQSRLAESHLPEGGHFTLPSSIRAIAPLVGTMLVDLETRRTHGEVAQIHVFHNRPVSRGHYEPVCQRLLPLDAAWQHEMASQPWPTPRPPEVLNSGEATLVQLVHEHLFISLFKACAESLASENASRLAAMQRAEKNIDDLLESLHNSFNRLRQSGIDEELFDVIAGFEALTASLAEAPHPAPTRLRSGV